MVFSHWLLSSHLWQLLGLQRAGSHAHCTPDGAKFPACFQSASWGSSLWCLTLSPVLLPWFPGTALPWFPPLPAPSLQASFSVLVLWRSFSSFHPPISLHSSVVQWLIFLCLSGHLTPSFTHLSPYFQQLPGDSVGFSVKAKIHGGPVVETSCFRCRGCGFHPCLGDQDARCPWLCAQLLSRVRPFAVPWDCSPPGSSVHGISQARILEWVAISYFRASSQPRDWACVSLHFLFRQADYLPLYHLGGGCMPLERAGKPNNSNKTKKRSPSPSIRFLCGPQPPTPVFPMSVSGTSAKLGSPGILSFLLFTSSSRLTPISWCLTFSRSQLVFSLFSPSSRELYVWTQKLEFHIISNVSWCFIIHLPFLHHFNM